MQHDMLDMNTALNKRRTRVFGNLLQSPQDFRKYHQDAIVQAVPSAHKTLGGQSAALLVAALQSACNPTFMNVGCEGTHR